MPERHLDVAVPEQLTNRVQVNARHHQLAGERVPQVVEREGSNRRRSNQRQPGVLDVVERLALDTSGEDVARSIDRSPSFGQDAYRLDVERHVAGLAGFRPLSPEQSAAIVPRRHRTTSDLRSRPCAIWADLVDGSVMPPGRLVVRTPLD